MENHHFSKANLRFLWPFYQAGSSMAPGRVSPMSPHFAEACRGSVGFVAHGDEDQGAAGQGLHEAGESLVGNLHMWKTIGRW